MWFSEAAGFSCSSAADALASAITSSTDGWVGSSEGGDCFAGGSTPMIEMPLWLGGGMLGPIMPSLSKFASSDEMNTGSAAAS